MIQEFSKFLESKTSFKIGSTLQVGHRPQGTPHRCNLVSEASGGTVYFDLPDRMDAVFSIISRAKSYLDARTDAWEIFKAIHGTAGWAFPVITSGVIYEGMTIEALSEPQYIGPDEDGRFEFSTNYIVRVQDK